MSRRYASQRGQVFDLRDPAAATTRDVSNAAANAPKTPPPPQPRLLSSSASFRHRRHRHDDFDLEKHCGDPNCLICGGLQRRGDATPGERRAAFQLSPPTLARIICQAPMRKAASTNLGCIRTATNSIEKRRNSQLFVDERKAEIRLEERRFQAVDIVTLVSGRLYFGVALNLQLWRRFRCSTSVFNANSRRKTSTRRFRSHSIACLQISFGDRAA